MPPWANRRWNSSMEPILGCASSKSSECIFPGPVTWSSVFRLFTTSTIRIPIIGTSQMNTLLFRILIKMLRRHGMPSVHRMMNQDGQLAGERNMVGTTVRILVAVIPSLNALVERRVVQDVRIGMVAESPLENGNLENYRKKGRNLNLPTARPPNRGKRQRKCR